MTDGRRFKHSSLGGDCLCSLFQFYSSILKPFHDHRKINDESSLQTTNVSGILLCIKMYMISVLFLLNTRGAVNSEATSEIRRILVSPSLHSESFFPQYIYQETKEVHNLLIWSFYSRKSFYSHRAANHGKVWPHWLSAKALDWHSRVVILNVFYLWRAHWCPAEKNHQTGHSWQATETRWKLPKI